VNADDGQEQPASADEDQQGSGTENDMQHHSGTTSFEVWDLFSMTPISSANGPNSHEATMQLQRKNA
jgi:hypothetical protein